ncbi:MAG: hypothetical protein LBI18_01345 [Planctomycetaceae bacterium]|jgi:hypothetical protein|nr:hypothetical protein [Planctomycetaceae bacterium]
MTTINVIRYADGRTIYNCKNPAYPPTNPKFGLEGNTVYWNERTRETSVVIPRQQDEYFSQTSPKITPSYFLTQPTTQEKFPAVATRSQSKDLYGRTAPVTLERGKNSIIVSRDSTTTNLVPCLPIPESKLSRIPNKIATSIQYPNQYQHQPSYPFHY